MVEEDEDEEEVMRVCRTQEWAREVLTFTDNTEEVRDAFR